MDSRVSLIDQKFILCIEPLGEICLLLGLMLHRDDVKVRHITKIGEVSPLEHQLPALIIIENTFAENQIASAIAAIKERAPASKLLMISSVGDEVKKKALAAGIDLFLKKPFDRSAFVMAALSMLH